MTKISDWMQPTKSSQLEKKVEGFCLIMAPLLIAASTFFWQNGEYGITAATLIIFSMFLWIPALKGLFSFIIDEMPRYAILGLWIAVFGCISGVCFAFLGYLTTVLNISHQRYIDSLSRYPGTSQLLLFGSGPLFPLSILILGIIVIIKRKVPAWMGILFCLGAIGFPVSRISRTEWIAHLADLCFLIPSFFIALPFIQSAKKSY